MDTEAEKPLKAKRTGRTHVSSERVRTEIEARFNPLKGFTPKKLADALQRYYMGYIADAARIWDRIAESDDQCASVIPKRERAVSLLKWEILTLDESPEAEEHKEALEFFYNNLTVSHALEQDMESGFSMLVSQMMDAAGKKYAVHEMAFEPMLDPASGKWRMTGFFNFVPLWFFEATTGKLRFLKNQWDLYGVDLEPGGWMVTAFKRPLMYATSIAYCFKNLALKDWSIYSEKFGMPWVHGKTEAEPGSDEWDEFADHLKDLHNDSVILTSMAAEIEALNVNQQGQPPQEKLVDRMDRALAILWRGGDLSTISSGNEASGASLQIEEVEDIENDDATQLSEILNKQVDRRVLKLLFGVDRGKAYISIQPRARMDTDKEIKTDQFLINAGVKIAVKDLAERYGRQMADEGDEVAEDRTLAIQEMQTRQGMEGAQDGLEASRDQRSDKKQLKEAVTGEKQLNNIRGGQSLNPDSRHAIASNDPGQLDNERLAVQQQADFLATASKQVAAAQSGVRYLVNRRLLDIADLPTVEEQKTALRQLRNDLPNLLDQMQQEDLTPAYLERIYTAAFFNGLDDARKELPEDET